MCNIYLKRGLKENLQKIEGQKCSQISKMDKINVQFSNLGGFWALKNLPFSKSEHIAHKSKKNNENVVTIKFLYYFGKGFRQNFYC
jgi:hypothetical protein